MTAPADVADFKDQFDRDFIYGDGKDSVRDIDIQRGLNEADSIFNPDIWVSAAEQKIAYLYASAHFMVMNIQMAGGLSAKPKGLGVRNRGGGIIAGKSVGQVSVTNGMPDSIVNDPILNQFMRTDYGLRYLAILTPRLVGNIAVVTGFNDVDVPDGF